MIISVNLAVIEFNKSELNCIGKESKSNRSTDFIIRNFDNKAICVAKKSISAVLSEVFIFE